jgi:hypothetical protein
MQQSDINPCSEAKGNVLDIASMVAIAFMNSKCKMNENIVIPTSNVDKLWGECMQ